ncbi:MAG: homoserine dehydrogenase [Ruminococcus sp.]|nr:homoserine dehydrogenase [Ruminococcus sp.]MCM1381623.1 homoserine dehydrogenase [Muribaculaceae bacterium]MCM1479499.1 homoserine dehydrogenase [Muribaculaceae bacterium]
MSKIAVLGYGVVGSGTVELFYKNKEKIVKKMGKELDIKYILDIRDFPDSPYAEKFTKNFEEIASDPEVTIVAEVMGGVGDAYTYTKKCLELGKSVVTSNKELVAKKGAELLKTAAEHRCNFLFEASTGGAIPIIRPLHQCLAGNDISAIAGILNGTTNFILTKMIREQMTFEDALAMAQKLGYAEKDPTADIEGHDACRKICILASLAFGKHVYPDWVYCEGITKLTLEDAYYAEGWGGAIKLIGSVKRTEDGKILPMVRPAFVCGGNQLSHISDVFNGIMVYGDAVDEVMFYGRGAGKLPTASAIVADVIDAAKMSGTSISQVWEDSADNSFIADYKDDVVPMYVRSKGSGKAKIASAFGDVEYIYRDGQPADELAFIVNAMPERDFDKAAEKFKTKGGEILATVRVLELD